MMCSKTIEIASYDDLCKIGNDDAYPLDASYVQTRDIDASESSDSEEGFKPIKSSFSGTYDGNGFSIKGLYIKPKKDGLNRLTGMFQFLRGDAVISNVNIVEANIIGGDDTGGIAGCNYGEIVNCSFNGIVTGSKNVGGLAGKNAGDIGCCKVSGNVSGKKSAGGIAGLLFGNVPFSIGDEENRGSLDEDVRGSINGCYIEADVHGRNCAGGVAGVSIGGSVNGCFVRGGENAGEFVRVKGKKNIGGVFGTCINGLIYGCCVKAKIYCEHEHYSGGLVGSCESTFGRLVGISDTTYSGGDDRRNLMGFYGDVRAFSTRDILRMFLEYCELRGISFEDFMFNC